MGHGCFVRVCVCVFYLNLDPTLHVCLHKPNLNDIKVTSFFCSFVALLIKGSNHHWICLWRRFKECKCKKQIIAGNSFSLFFLFPLPYSCPPSFSLSLFYSFCQEMSFITAHTDSYSHTSVKYSPLVDAFCPWRDQTNCSPTGCTLSFLLHSRIHTGRTFDHQGLINNLWLWLKLSNLANLNGNV